MIDNAVRADTPPSKHAMNMLRNAYNQPFPAQEVNFTVRDKLILLGLAELRDQPSPYKSHKLGRTVPFLFVTDKGKKALADV